MKKKNTFIYLAVFTVLLLIMSFPRSGSESIRGSAISFLASPWEFIIRSKFFVKDPLGEGRIQLSSEKLELTEQEEIEKLKLEKYFLQNEILQIKELILNVESSLAKLDFKTVPARIIFRSPSSWNSSLWIGVGDADNPKDQRIIAKNSPVLVGKSLIGVIDYVGKHQSRIKLITDSGLTPSVRSVRGGIQNKLLYEKIDVLSMQIDARTDLFSDAKLKKDFLHLLDGVKKKISLTEESWYLAKGEISGSSKTMWRAKAHVLQGIGFNFDFEDDLGSARDLRTGSVIGKGAAPTMPILKIGDLLVTTGLDGVFPAGLHVAEVSKIKLLKEGDYYYELEAIPTAGNLEDLSLVFVIPPQDFNADEKPPVLGR